MSHEITIRSDGFAEATFARIPAWHQLAGHQGELVLDRDLISDDVRKVMGFEPKKRPYWVKDENGEYHKSDIACGVFRSDNGVELGMVSPTYETVSHLTFGLDMFDSLMMDGLMKYESGFTLQGGKNVVILAKLPGYHEVAEGDVTLPYLMGTFNHTGASTVRFLPTSIRVVCANTERMALAAGKGQILKVRHSGDVEFKMDEARQALSEIDDAFTKHTAVARELVKTKVTNDSWKVYLDNLFPVPSITDKDFTQRKQNTVRETRKQVTWNLVNDPAQQIPSTRHSWYAGYNAVTQWIDHRDYKGVDAAAKAETAFRVANFGTGNDLKVKAWNSALALSSN